METQILPFNNLIEKIYSLPLDDKEEIKKLLELNIAESRRDEMFKNFKQAEAELKLGKLNFSTDITELKKTIL